MARIPKSQQLNKRSIVWMGILDPRINNFKDRPVLIVSDDDGSGTFDGLAITTRFGNPLNEEEVMVADHPMTGLKQPCAVNCKWPQEVETQRVRKVAGRMPSANFEEVLARVKLLREKGLLPDA